jgi:hypothetical protein
MFSIFNLIHITNSVPSLTLRCRSSSQVLTNRERRRFESNSYPAGDLFLTQTMLPPSGSRRSPMTLSKKPRDNNHGSHYPGTARLPGRTLGLLFASPYTPFNTSLPTRVYPGSKSVASFAVERYFIRPAKCEACVQHDKRDEQRSVLNRHRQKTNSTPEPCLVASNFSVRSPIIHQHLVTYQDSQILLTIARYSPITRR